MCLPTVFSRSMVVSAVCASIAVGITLVVMSITVRAQQEIGRRLFEAVVNYMKRQGAVTMRTLVEKNDPELASFLRAVGFQDAPLTALEMRIS